MRRAAAFAISASMFLASETFAQEREDSLAGYLVFNNADEYGFLITLFPSFFIQHGMELKEFVSSRTFTAIRKTYGDRRAADALFIRAMNLTEDNTGIALLIATIACFDHKIVGMNVPFLSLAFPLTGESDAEFKRRVNHLPANLYDDTPAGRAGDRDKLQHFFGSAFIAYSFESRGAAMRVGEFVEKGEDAFIVGGVNDDRDLRADVQGQQFGLSLLENNRRVPSEFLKTELATEPRHPRADFSSMCCSGAW